MSGDIIALWCEVELFRLSGIGRVGVLPGHPRPSSILPLLGGRKPKPNIPKIPKITKYKSESFEAVQVKLSGAYMTPQPDKRAPELAHHS